MSNADDRPSHTFVQYLYPDARGCLHQDVPSGPFCGRPSQAHQPEPSGDEAKVREILDRTGWFFEVPRDRAQLVGHDEVLGLLREAYAAGKADGAREEREACGKLGRDVQAHYERQILVEQQSGAYQGEVVATAKREIGKRIADAIARRGSEGK